ncbi:unnamed protein product [Lupinus luteus]|uniref:Uncharacterized protein n=1 Tax=Lupinus luteus TaxID=3873 RepID=A0AAV1WME9_LUPLU
MASASTRTQMKWQKVEEKKQQKSMAKPYEYATSSSDSQELGIKNVEEGNEQGFCSSGFATPKGKRFRIPEILTCPPAPKKRRVISKYSAKRSRKFFASPDIELFFFSAFRNVSA